MGYINEPIDELVKFFNQDNVKDVAFKHREPNFSTKEIN
jgi:hypothetical protein